MRKKLKLAKTTINNLYNVPVVDGQVIVGVDGSQFCYDMNGQRYTVGSRYVYTATGNQDDVKLSEFISNIPGNSAEVVILGNFQFLEGLVDISSENLVSITLDWSNAKVYPVSITNGVLFIAGVENITIKNLAINLMSNSMLFANPFGCNVNLVGCHFNLQEYATLGAFDGSIVDCTVETSDYYERKYLVASYDVLRIEGCKFFLSANTGIFSTGVFTANLIFTNNNVVFRNSESGVDFPLISTERAAFILSNNHFIGKNIGEDVVINTNSSESVAYTNNIFRSCGVMVADEFINDYLVNIHIS